MILESGDTAQYGSGATTGVVFQVGEEKADERGDRGVALGGADARMAIEIVADGDGDVLHGNDWRAREDCGLPPLISIVRAGAVILCKSRDLASHRKDVVVYKLQNGEAMAEKLTNYDPAEDLGSDEAIAIFMAEAFQTNDAGYISHALGVVARAKGMAQIASQTGLSREQLYRSFSAMGNPTLKTLLAVMKALAIALTAKVSDAA